MNITPVLIAASGLAIAFFTYRFFPRDNERKFVLAASMALMLAMLSLAVFTLQMRYYNHVAYFAIDALWVAGFLLAVLMMSGIITVPKSPNQSHRFAIPIGIFVACVGLAHATALRATDVWPKLFYEFGVSVGALPTI